MGEQTAGAGEAAATRDGLPAGGPRRARGGTDDIRAQWGGGRRAADALQHMAIEAMAEGILVYDARGTIAVTNPAARSILGVEGRELEGRGFFPPDILVLREDGTPMPPEESPVGVSLRTGRSTQGIVLGVQRRGRELRWLSVSTQPLLDGAGQARAAVATLTDVTDRKRVEEQLRATEARFRTLAEESPVGIFQADQRGAIVYVNRPGLRILGIGAEQALGKGLLGRIHPAERAHVTSLWDAMVADGREFSAEFRAGRSDGRQLVLRGRANAVRGADGGTTGFIGVFLDVTEQRRLEAQLGVASRMMAVGTLVSGVAHEINNPLGGAMASHGFVAEEVERLRDAIASGAPIDRAAVLATLDEVRSALDDALAGERRIAGIVRDLALFARPDPHRQPVAPARVVDAALRWIPASLRQAASIQVEHDAVPDVVGAEGQLSQVVVNLVSNAIKAAPAGRKADVRIRVGPGDDGTARIEVVDDGVGMAPEVIQRIFDPFFTTREPGKGMGLGLSISHAIVTAHGGTITATSEPGKGSTFRVELPALSATSAAPA